MIYVVERKWRIKVFVGKHFTLYEVKFTNGKTGYEFSGIQMPLMTKLAEYGDGTVTVLHRPGATVYLDRGSGNGYSAAAYFIVRALPADPHYPGKYRVKVVAEIASGRNWQSIRKRVLYLAELTHSHGWESLP